MIQCQSFSAVINVILISTGSFSHLPLAWEGVEPRQILLIFSSFGHYFDGLLQGL
jgi:hypothetical protein